MIFHSSLPCIHTYSFGNVRSRDATPIRYEISFVSAMLLKLHMYFVFCVVNFEIPSKWMGFRCPCLNGHEFQIDFKINDTWSKPVRNVGWYKVIFLSEKNIAPPPRPDPWKRELSARKHRDQFRRFQGRNFISKLQNPIDMAFFLSNLSF